MRVVLLGSTGYIGQQVLSMMPDAITPRIDIGDAVAVRSMLKETEPDVLINCAGKTGRPNVDWCEIHKDQTLHANVLGPLVLREACAEQGVYWVHMSSGCIYEGDNGGRGFSENDPPNFAGSYYSKTKAWSEQILKDFPDILILRPRMPFDGTDNPRNLLQKLIKYSKVLDAPNSLTYVPDMLAAMRVLIDRRATGIYNVVNPGLASPYQIMERYREIVNPAHRFDRLTPKTLAGVVTTGRSNCFLSPKKLLAEGITMLPVDIAVEHALAQLAAFSAVTVA